MDAPDVRDDPCRQREQRGIDAAPTMGCRLAALAGIVAPVVFAVGIVVAGLTWPGFSHRTQNISDLGGLQAPHPVIQNLNFAMFGLLVLALATGLARCRVGWRGAGAVAALVGFFGVMMVVQGLTPCTPGCRERTPTDVVHGLAAIAGFVAVAAAMLLRWRRVRTKPGWAAYGRLSAVAGLLTLVLLIAWWAAAAVDPDRLHAGVLQRSAVAPVLVWLAITAARLHRSAVLRPDEPR